MSEDPSSTESWGQSRNVRRPLYRGIADDYGSDPNYYSNYYYGSDPNY